MSKTLAEIQSSIKWFMWQFTVPQRRQDDAREVKEVKNIRKQSSSKQTSLPANRISSNHQMLNIDAESNNERINRKGPSICWQKQQSEWKMKRKKRGKKTKQNNDYVFCTCWFEWIAVQRALLGRCTGNRIYLPNQWTVYGCVRITMTTNNAIDNVDNRPGNAFSRRCVARRFGLAQWARNMKTDQYFT